MLDDVVAAEFRPRTLFEEGTDRSERLMAAIDAVNERHGCFSVVTAALGFDRKWNARADSKSPAWTTWLAEVPMINAWR